MNALVTLAVFALGSIQPAKATDVAPPLQEYLVDAGHSIIEFSIGFAFSRVKGRFTDAKGTILYDAARPANSSVTIVINAKSIDTGWPHRDEHLRTSDFFDVEKYPRIVFQSTRVRESGNGWIAEGPLTMHGVTRPVSIPFHLLRAPVRSTESNWMMMDVAGALRLARADFGIFGGSTFNSWFNKARAATMSDSVDIDLEIEGYSADAESQQSPGIVGALERIRTGGVEAQISRLVDLKKQKTPAEFDAYVFGGELLVSALVAQKRVDDAVKLSRALTEMWPTYHGAHLLHGFALTVAGDKRGASAQFAKGKEVFKPPVRDPNEKFPQVDDNWYYLDQIARTAVELGNASAAVPLAKTITEIYPTTARAHTTYGIALAARGDSTGAAAAYANALRVDPDETRAMEWSRR
ncbi:MAG: YceI family protein [Gemmatimonadaceae bacterium]